MIIGTKCCTSRTLSYALLVCRAGELQAALLAAWQDYQGKCEQAAEDEAVRLAYEHWSSLKEQLDASLANEQTALKRPRADGERNVSMNYSDIESCKRSSNRKRMATTFFHNDPDFLSSCRLQEKDLKPEGKQRDCPRAHASQAILDVWLPHQRQGASSSTFLASRPSWPKLTRADSTTFSIPTSSCSMTTSANRVNALVGHMHVS